MRKNHGLHFYTFNVKGQLNILKNHLLILTQRRKNSFLYNLLQPAILNLCFYFWFATLSTGSLARARLRTRNDPLSWWRRWLEFLVACLLFFGPFLWPSFLPRLFVFWFVFHWGSWNLVPPYLWEICSKILCECLKPQTEPNPV